MFNIIKLIKVKSVQNNADKKCEKIYKLLFS